MAKGDLGILPPDPKNLIDQATRSNIDTAAAQSQINNVNQTTPFGSSTWTQTKDANGVPSWTQNVNLTKEQQALLSGQQQVQGQMLNLAGSNANQLKGLLAQPIQTPGYIAYSQAGPSLTKTVGDAGQINRTIADAGNIQQSIAGAGPIQSSIAGAGGIQRNLGVNDYGANVKSVEDALYARINPQIERDRTRLETQLANQGIRVGSDAYRKAMDDQSRAISDQRTSITLQAGQEQNRLQNLALNAGNFANTAQAQQFGQNAAQQQAQNAAQAQLYGQNANDATFRNTAQAQQYGQNANDAQFGNNAQAQQFAQLLQKAGFSNQAIQQMFQNKNTVTGLNNDIANMRFGNDLGVRNQRLNEQAALMNGTPVGMPQFPGTGATGVAGVDTAGIQNNRYNQMQNLWGGLLGGVGNLAGAFF